jgi:hypothetical protein
LRPILSHEAEVNLRGEGAEEESNSSELVTTTCYLEDDLFATAAMKLDNSELT